MSAPHTIAGDWSTGDYMSVDAFADLYSCKLEGPRAPEIANLLVIAGLLGKSEIQYQGNTIRITDQMIKAATAFMRKPEQLTLDVDPGSDEVIFGG